MKSRNIISGKTNQKHLVVVAGKDDDIFPVAAVREAFGCLKMIYKTAGFEERCKLVIGKGGHRFYANAMTRGRYCSSLYKKNDNFSPDFTRDENFSRKPH